MSALVISAMYRLWGRSKLALQLRQDRGVRPLVVLAATGLRLQCLALGLGKIDVALKPCVKNSTCAKRQDAERGTGLTLAWLQTCVLAYPVG